MRLTPNFQNGMSSLSTCPPVRAGHSLIPVHKQLLGFALMHLTEVEFEGLTWAINRIPLPNVRSNSQSTTRLKTLLVENLRTVENSQNIDPVVRNPVNQPVVALQYFSNFIASKFGYHLT
jgi:hypothetical protein